MFATSHKQYDDESLPQKCRVGLSPALFATMVIFLTCCSDAGGTILAEPGMTTVADWAETSSVASSAGETTTSSTSLPEYVTIDGYSGVADPVELGEALLAAESKVRDPALLPEVRLAWGRLQQRLYAAWSANDGWTASIQEHLGNAADVDPEAQPLVDAIELNWRARQHLNELVKHHGIESELPAWQISAPLPAAELLGFYKEASARTGIEWEYLAAINIIETRVGRISGVSSAGAVGPMQFLPTTWAECCEGDPTVDRDAIIGAATYLVVRGGPEEMDRAIRGYNNSADYVEAVKAYASVLRENEEAYFGYYSWQVHFRTTAGLVELPEGYFQAEPIAVGDWLEANPEAVVSD